MLPLLVLSLVLAQGPASDAGGGDAELPPPPAAAVEATSPDAASPDASTPDPAAPEAPPEATGGGETPPDGATITIDPAAVEGIRIEAPGGDAEEPEEAGAVEKLFENSVPKTGNEAVDESVGTLSKTLSGFIDGFISMLPQLVIALLVLVATAFLAQFLYKFSRRGFAKMRFKDSLRDLFGQLIYIGVWFLGLIIAAGIVFPGFGVAQLVTTAGLASIAIGFAFQDIFKNFFAGVSILWSFPFAVGDFIEVDGTDVKGRVEDIWIRMTLIRQTDEKLICVPNSTIYDNPVRVLTNHATRRQTVACGVAYGEDVGEARKVIKEAVARCKTVAKGKPIQIFLTGFGSSSMDFEVTWWAGSTPLQERESRDEVVESVKRALDDAGIEIPYPYRTLTFTPNEPLIMDTLRRAASGAGDNGRGGEGRS